MNYTISQVSKKMNISPSAIRYYEQEGLLPYIHRNDSGVRYFTDDDVERISFISCLKKTGMTIKEIQLCFAFCDMGNDTIDERIHLFQSHKQSILNQIRELEKCITNIDDKVEFLQNKKVGYLDNQNKQTGI